MEKKIIIFDANIIKKIIKPKYLDAKYPQYFQPEIKPFINEKWFPKYDTKSNKYCSTENDWIKEIENDLPEDFNEMRQLGENESYICNLIRNDLVEEFIAFVNRNNYSLNSVIKSSIFETNSFLIKQIESDKGSRYNNHNSKPNDIG